MLALSMIDCSKMYLLVMVPHMQEVPPMTLELGMTGLKA
jgi:hypothetical protein